MTRNLAGDQRDDQDCVGELHDGEAPREAEPDNPLKSKPESARPSGLLLEVLAIGVRDSRTDLAALGVWLLGSQEEGLSF